MHLIFFFPSPKKCALALGGLSAWNPWEDLLVFPPLGVFLLLSFLVFWKTLSAGILYELFPPSSTSNYSTVSWPSPCYLDRDARWKSFKSSVLCLSLLLSSSCSLSARFLSSAACTVSLRSSVTSTRPPYFWTLSGKCFLSNLDSEYSKKASQDILGSAQACTFGLRLGNLSLNTPRFWSGNHFCNKDLINLEYLFKSYFLPIAESILLSLRNPWTKKKISHANLKTKNIFSTS